MVRELRFGFARPRPLGRVVEAENAPFPILTIHIVLRTGTSLVDTPYVGWCNLSTLEIY